MTERPAPPPADLPEVGELHALYRAGAASEPGAQLDQRILAAARADLRAAGGSAARRQRPWWKAWLKPASVMAVAVLGLSLSWQLSDQQERDRRQEIGSARDQPQADKPEPRASAPQPGAAAPADQAPALKERAPSPAEQSAPARRQAAEPAAAAAPQAFPAQREAAKSKAGAASGSVAEPVQAPLPVLPAAPAEKKNLRADDARSKDDRGNAALSGSALTGDKREAERRAAPSAADALGESTAEPATPQAWLQQIRDLRAARREAEAAQSLARFRLRYPDFVVPDDLKALN